jgi:P22 coat protein - gene protein 5
MANNQLLTTDMIADRALMRFSENCSFINTIPKTYATEFKEGAPAIGDTLRVAIPQHAEIVSGRVAQPAPMQTILGQVKVIDQLNFSIQYTSSELALDIEEFDKRYLSQQVADLAVTVEAAVQNLAMLSIPNQTGPGSAAQWTQLGYANLAKKYIEDNGGGKSTKSMLANSTAETTIIPALAGLFNAQKQLDTQYEDGVMGRAAGFDWNSSSVSPIFTNGAGTGYLVNGANQQGSTIIVDTGTGAVPQGTIITFTGVVAVHPQTKASLGYLRQFVVTANYAGGGGSISIYPALTVTGSEQNVTNVPADNAPITIDQPASATYGISLAYRPEAFAFATVDLPELTGWKNSRRQFNGVSMRVVEGSSLVNDMNLTRFDIMYAFGALRPQWATRITNSTSMLTPV